MLRIIEPNHKHVNNVAKPFTQYLIWFSVIWFQSLYKTVSISAISVLSDLKVQTFELVNAAMFHESNGLTTYKDPVHCHLSSNCPTMVDAPWDDSSANQTQMKA